MGYKLVSLFCGCYALEEVASDHLTALSVDERRKGPGEPDRFVLELKVKPGYFSLLSAAEEETGPRGKGTSRGHISLL